MSRAASQKRGQSGEVECLGTWLAQRASSLQDQEGSMQRLLESLTLDGDAAEPAARRRRTSQASGEPPELLMRRVFYRTTEFGARVQVLGVAAQGMPRQALVELLPHTVDVDMRNAAFSIVSQLLTLLELERAPMFQEETRTIEELATRREAIIRDRLRTDFATGKQLLLATLGGQALLPAWVEDPLLKRVRRAARFLRWAACSHLPEVYEEKSRVENKWAPASTFAIWWQRVECHLLHVWTQWILTLGEPAHISLHYDGLRLDKPFVERIGGVNEFLRQSEAAIHERSGFHIQLAEKRHFALTELIAASGAAASPVPPDRPEMLQAGNCIPLALFRLREPLQGMKESLFSPPALQDAEVLRRGYRSYASCFAECGVAWEAHFGFLPKESGPYVVHCETHGSPHAIAVLVRLAEDEAIVFDRDIARTMQLSVLRDLVGSSVDQKLVVSFHLAVSPRRPSPIYAEADKVRSLHQLGDLVAGASGGLPRLPDDITDVRGSLLRALHTEVTRYENDLRDETTRKVFLRSSGDDIGRRCRLCPFRRFRLVKELRLHVSGEHVARVHYAAAGRKSLGVVYALHDNDALRGDLRGSYLQRAAEHLRSSVVPPPPSGRTRIDRCLILILSASGAHYGSADAAPQRCDLRRVSNVYFDRSFAELLFREAVIARGRVRRLLPTV